MAALKRDHMPSIGQLEKQIKKNEYTGQYTEFDVFWRRYKRTKDVEKPVFLPAWQRWAGLGAASLAAVMLVFFGINRLFWTGNTSQVSWNRVSGNGVQISRNDGARWQVVDNKVFLAAGTRLRTDSSSEAGFTLRGGIHLKVYPSSSLKILSMSREKTFIELAYGELAYVSGKLPEYRSVNIATPLLNIVVTGTSFLVNVDRDRNVRISVVEGQIRITPLGYLFEGAGLSGSGARRLTDQVLEKAFYPVSQTVELKAADQRAFYDSSLELIKRYEADIRKGNTAPCAEKIIVMFHEMASTKAHFTATAEKYRADLPNLSDESKTGKWNFRLASVIKTAVTGKESEILELPGGRQCYTVDRKVIFLASSSAVEREITVGGENQILTRPQLAGDRIVFGSDKGGLYAIDLQGMMVWTKNDAGMQVLNAFPLSCGTKIVVPTVDNGLRFFDLNGTPVPTLIDGEKEGLFYSPMALKNCEAVLFGNGKGDFTVFNIEENKILWHKNLIQEVSVFALAGDDRVAVIQSRKSGITVAVRPMDGSVIWRENIGGGTKTHVNPSVDGNRVVISGDETLYIIDMLSGKVISEKKFTSRIVSMKWFRGKVLIGEESGILDLYDAASGKAETVYQSKGPISRISVRGGVVTFFTGDALVRLKAENLES